MNVPSHYTSLEKSERRPAPGARRVAAADAGEHLSVTIRLRRRVGAPALPTAPTIGQHPMSREAFAESYGADPKDIAAVTAFAKHAGLKIETASIPRRVVTMSGTVEQMNRAFAVDLGRYESPRETYRGREGKIHLPASIAPIVEGVFGLDNRRMARPAYSGKARPTAAQMVLTPPQVASLYDFPTTQAVGQTIGLLEFGGGYDPNDIAAFFNNLGLATPALTAVGVDGAGNAPGSDADVEVALDIDVAGSVAQGANIAVYFAPWTEQGWVDIVTTAVHDAVNNPSVLSISWGWPELETVDGLTWSQAAIQAVSSTFQEATALGVTVLAASGDQGSDCQIGDGRAHALYPTSDPWVTSCGGTSISDVAGGAFGETTWNDNGATGGGVSDIFPAPDFQSWSNVPPSVNDGHAGRGVPDVAGNADPNSGYVLVIGGQSVGPIGGTSAVAPLYAGFVALANATLGEPLGYLNYNLYNLANSPALLDIADGGSNAFDGAPGYTAGPGYDCCTGLGRIDGNVLINMLRATGRQPGLIAYGPGLLMAWKGMERDDSMWWSTFDGANWAPQQQIPGVASSAGPSLAVFNGLVYAIWKGEADDQSIWYTTFDGANWAPQQQTGGMWSTHGPSLAVYNGLLYAAWKGMFFDQRIWYSTFDGANWAPQQVAPGVATSVGPSLAAYNGLLYMAWKGEETDQGLWFTSFDGNVWAPQQNIAGVASTQGPTLAVYNNLLYAAWKGWFGDQSLWWSSFDGNAWAPQQQIPNVASSVGPALATSGNLLYATWKGWFGDQSIWFSSFDGNVWAPQQEIAAWTSPDLLRVKRLQAELRDAQAALKLSEEKQDAVVGAAALRHARGNAKFGKELAAMLRAEVKAKADRAIVADLLVDDASQLAKAG
jgi:hypothetical protein